MTDNQCTAHSKLTYQVFKTENLNKYVSDPEATLALAMLKAVNSTHKETAEQNSPEISQSDTTDAEQETTPDKDAPLTPSPVTPDTVKRSSWSNDQHSPRHAKMLFKNRTLSVLPIGNPKMKPENRFLANLRQRSLDETCYMKNTFDNDEETALYFKLLFFGCLCMLVWKHIWLLPVMLFFLAIHGLKIVLDYFGVWLFFENQYNNVMCKIKCWWNNRYALSNKIMLPNLKKF